VYLSASWKQRERVRALAEALRDEGHEVYDFTDPRCRKTPEIPPEAFPLQFDPERETYREYITGNPYYKAAVHSNYEVIEWCDVVLLLLPAGCDSHADWALGVGMRKKSAVVGQPKAGERTPSHLWCDQFLDRDEDVSGWLETLELEMPMRSRLPDLKARQEFIGDFQDAYKKGDSVIVNNFAPDKYEALVSHLYGLMHREASLSTHADAVLGKQIGAMQKAAEQGVPPAVGSALNVSAKS
jgi:hypothetical protein